MEFVILCQKEQKNHPSSITNKGLKKRTEEGVARVTREIRISLLHYLLVNSIMFNCFIIFIG